MKDHRGQGPYPKESRAFVVKYLHDGMSIREASRRFGVSTNTLAVWRHDEVAPDNTGISNLDKLRSNMLQ